MCQGVSGGVRGGEDWEVSNVIARTSTNIQRQFPFLGKYPGRLAGAREPGDPPSRSQHDDF